MTKNIQWAINYFEAEVLPRICKKWKICGSVRRKKLNPGDVDILVIPNDDFTLQYIPHKHVLADGKIKKRVIWQPGRGDGVQIDFQATNKHQWGAAMLYFTGSKWFNIQMRSRAISIGYKLNEYGLWRKNAEGEWELYMSNYEKYIFEALNMNYVKPEKRG